MREVKKKFKGKPLVSESSGLLLPSSFQKIYHSNEVSPEEKKQLESVILALQKS